MTPSIDGPGGSSESSLAELLAAAGDTTRIEILALLRARPRSVREICEALDSAQPRVSHHLGILLRHGLLEVEVKGRQRIHRWPRDQTHPMQRELSQFIERWLVQEAVERGGAQTSIPAVKSSEELEDFLL